MDDASHRDLIADIPDLPHIIIIHTLRALELAISLILGSHRAAIIYFYDS